MSLSDLVFEAGCGIRLYRFLIIAFFIYFIHIFQRSNSMGLDPSFESTFWELVSLTFVQTFLAKPRPECKVSE